MRVQSIGEISLIDIQRWLERVRFLDIEWDARSKAGKPGLVLRILRQLRLPRSFHCLWTVFRRGREIYFPRIFDNYKRPFIFRNYITEIRIECCTQPPLKLSLVSYFKLTEIERENCTKFINCYIVNNLPNFLWFSKMFWMGLKLSITYILNRFCQNRANLRNSGNPWKTRFLARCRTTTYIFFSLIYHEILLTKFPHLLIKIMILSRVRH